MTNAQEVRLRLIERGYTPVPLHGKIPSLKNWQRLENVTREQVAMWAKTWSDAGNTGALTRLMPTLDIDVLAPDAVRAVVEHVRERFEERGYVPARVGKAPKTALVFRTLAPFAKIIATLVAPNGDTSQKIELLADGQQVVVDGVHPDTRQPYRWQGGTPLEIARHDLAYIDAGEAQQLVDEVVEILVRDFGYTRAKERPGKRKTNGAASEGAASGGAADWKHLLDSIRAGQSLHDSLRDLAAKMIASGMAPGAAVNQLRAILEGSSAPRDDRFAARMAEIPALVESAQTLTKADEQASNNNDADEGHWHGEASPNDSRTWAIHDLVPEVGKGLISGQWGTFKTFTALDMAHSMMSGAPFLGFDVVRRGGVAFLALEGQSEIPVRLQAVIDQRGVISGKAPFVWYENSPPLLSAGAVRVLVKRLDKAAAKLKADFDLPLVAVFIDTIVLAAGYTKDGADNDTATTNVVLRTMAELATKGGCFVFGIDHFGKNIDVGTRGNSVKEGNADVVLALLGDRAITGEISNTKLAIRKRRGGANGQEFPFRPQTVDMGIDQHGKTVTTLVLDWGVTAEPPKGRKDDWGHGGGKLLRQTIMGLLAECGVDLKPFADGPVVKALKVEDVRAEFFKRRVAEGGTEDAKRRAKRIAFRRALAAAVDRGVIAAREFGGVEYVWLVSPHAEMHGHMRQ